MNKSRYIKIDTTDYNFDKNFIQKKCDDAYESNKENIDVIIKYLAKR